MRKVDELIALYNRINGNREDFMAIGLYKKLASGEVDLEFYYNLIRQSRNGYIKDPTAG